jgi:hypothetical protein
MGQVKSTIDFDDILNSGKILICNFSKGKIGDDNTELFGATVLAKIQASILRRSRLSRNERKPFYLYVDEFQNFATQNFMEMLSEARKYKLSVTMAHQSITQLEELDMLGTILSNASTVVCFRTGSPMDAQYLLPLFRPYIEEGDLTHLPGYNFYIQTNVIDPQEPTSGQTLLIRGEGSEDAKEAVIQSSRKLYGRKYIEPKKPKVSTVPTDKTSEQSKNMGEGAGGSVFKPNLDPSPKPQTSSG